MVPQTLHRSGCRRPTVFSLASLIVSLVFVSLLVWNQEGGYRYNDESFNELYKRRPYNTSSTSTFLLFASSSLARVTFQSPPWVFVPRTILSNKTALITEGYSHNISTLHHYETNATLIILIGQPRGGNLAWETFRRQMLYPMNASLATIFPCRNGTVRTALEDMAAYNWCFNEPSDWALYFDDIHDRCPQRSSSNWRTSFCRKDMGDYQLSFLGGLYSCLADSNLGPKKGGSGSIQVVMRWLALQKIKEFNLDQKFHHLILTRADYLYLSPPLHPRILNDTGIVYIPDGEGYGGYTDRYIAGSMKTMIKAIDWADEVVCHSARYRGVANAEQVLKSVLEKKGIRPVFFGFTMFSVRSSQDPTSWSTGVHHHQLQKFNLKVKYVEELSSSVRNTPVDLESYLMQVRSEMKML
jgi:hypothetical protein